jgi:hypothetical protein
MSGGAPPSTINYWYNLQSHPFKWHVTQFVYFKPLPCFPMYLQLTKKRRRSSVWPRSYFYLPSPKQMQDGFWDQPLLDVITSVGWLHLAAATHLPEPCRQQTSSKIVFGTVGYSISAPPTKTDGPLLSSHSAGSDSSSVTPFNSLWDPPDRLDWGLYPLSWRVRYMQSCKWSSSSNLCVYNGSNVLNRCGKGTFGENGKDRHCQEICRKIEV